MDPERFTVNPSRISKSEKAKSFRNSTVEQILLNMEKEKLKPFGLGDIVVTLEGDFAGVGLKVVEIKDKGMVCVMPAPNAPIVEIERTKLFHFDDFHEALKVALVEEQTFNPDQPQ